MCFNKPTRNIGEIKYIQFFLYILKTSYTEFVIL